MSEPASSSRSLVRVLVGIIIVLGCLVLAGLGVGGYFLVAGPPEFAQGPSPTFTEPVHTETPAFTPSSSPTPTETPAPVTTILEAVADTWIVDKPPSATGGREVVVYVGTKTGVRGRALFRFDLSGIPTGATVFAATFEVYGSVPSGPPTLDVELWRIDTMWDERTVSWNIPLNYTDTRAVTPVAHTAGYYAWTITSLVQSWVSGTPNHGVILISSTEGPDGARGFGSRESSNPPRLTVAYFP